MPAPAPFWLCHECGAQMRPVTVNGVSHCASCNGEFIEILDPEVNPDPFHELPPAPPTRPGGPNSPSQQRSPPSPSFHQNPGQGGQSFLSSLFGNIMGAAVDQHQGEGSQSASANASAGSGVGSTGHTSTHTGSGAGSSSAGSSRTFSFNFPGGGRGQVVFGSFNGGGGGGMGPFGPTGQGRTTGGMDFESLFPQGFGPPRPGQAGARPLGPGDPMDGAELLRSLMAAMGDEGQMGPGGFFGQMGRGNLGDYATSEQGFNDILERLMQAAGPQGPLPASDIVIEGLPRFKFDNDKKLAESVYKDCPVCKDDFSVGDEVVRIPCAHIFHPDCLVPWLKQNGSCPVCRFSLVPEEEDRARRSAPQANPDQNQNPEGGQSTMTSILNRLFGQGGGTTSNPTSPTGNEPNPFPFGTAGQATQTPAPPINTSNHTSTTNTQSQPPSATPATADIAQTDPPSPSLPASGQPISGSDQPSLSIAIPEDYRARHRERERQRQQHEDSDNIDHFDLD